MGKVRRTLCISLPYALSAASLVCLANMTDFGSVIDKTLGELISRRSFMDNSLSVVSDSVSGLESQANQVNNAVQDITDDAGSTITETVGNAITGAEDLAQSASEKIAQVLSNVPDFYTIGLWNYCEGFANGTGPAFVNCTEPSSAFWFNVTDVLGLEVSWAEELFPSQYKSVLKIYKSLSKGTVAFFIMAVIANVLTIVLGLAGMLSRWGSLFTSVFAVASVVFNIVRLILATAAYFLLTGIFKLSLNGIVLTLGQPMLVVSCLATGFSISASLLWFLSSCCCSGR
ncbi:SUR7/PalI family protein [Aspergillus foveolatus]|uniref:SUR7/PalI family protein n=1 Tax=Aspergillus foveolatus TaxID=210207 RepID=UPI003CCCB7A8